MMNGENAMDNSLKLVEDEMAALAKARAEAEAEATAAQARLREIEAKLRDMEIENRVLERLKNRGSSGAETPSVATSSNGHVFEVYLLNPTDAVLQFLKEHPGSKGFEIADALAGKIDTKSSDPRRLLFNTVWQLKKKGKIVERKKKLHLKDEEVMQQSELQ
jgi:hypothetical protein